MVDAEKSRAEARAILDKFARDIGKVKTSDIVAAGGNDIGTRIEGDGRVCDKDFKTIMFKNAPKSDEECLIVEKGAWV